MTQPGTNAEPGHPKYRPDIDGLRAIAVLSVIGFHAFPALFKGGFVGVDVFFVISGFLISSIIVGGLRQESFNYLVFYTRRINRIFPALILVLGACYLVGWLDLLADEYKQLGKHIAAGAAFVSNFVLWSESGYFDNSADLKPLLHLWSLGVEEQFYVVMPVLLWFAWKRRISLLIVVAVIAFVSFLLNVWSVSTHPVATFFSPFTRFWEIMAGSLLVLTSGALGTQSQCKAARDRHASVQVGLSVSARRFTSEILSVVGLGLILFAVFVVNREREFPGWLALVPVAGASLIIACGPGALLNRRVLSSRPLVWIGLISYPLYLWHWPLLSFARIMEGEDPSQSIRLSVVVASVALAWLTYRFVEQPIRFGRHKGRKAIVLLALMLTIGYAGFNVYQRDGLDFRPAAKAGSVNKFDFPYRQTCEAFSGEKEEFGQDWCNLPDEAIATANTILIGDSYSNAYTTVLDAYKSDGGTDLSYLQLGRALCPFLLDYGPPYCKTFASKVRDYIVSNANIKTVILAFNWPFYYQKGKGVSWPNIFHHEGEGKLEAAFERTVSDFQAHGKRVVVMLPPPGGANPRACVVRPFKISDNNVCDLPLTRAQEVDGAYREYLLPKLATQKVTFFDPFPYLCDAAHCKTTDGNRILYYDNGHLSVFGGEFLAQGGRKALEKMLR